MFASLHPKQRQFAEDPHRRVAAALGRGAGKTTAAMCRLVLRMVRNRRARCVFIATTREHARDLIWEDLKNLLSMQNLDIEATFNETRQTVTLSRNGSELKLTGADDKREIDKLRGKSFHEVAIDEAASHDPKLLEWLIKRVVGPRLGEYKGSIVLFGSPGHDMRGLFYEATGPGSKAHRPYEQRDLPEYAGWVRWSSHHWTVADGAPYVEALANELAEHLIEKEAEQWSDDHPVWRREYLGKWAADDTAMMFRYRPTLTGDAAREHGVPDGTPWNQWDPPRVGSHQFAELPNGPDGKPRTDWQYAYGFDMGHSDPFATVVLAFSPSDTTRSIYHVYSFEKVKLYIREIAQLLLGVDEKQPTQCAPHERPTGLFQATGYPIGMVSDVMHLGGTILDELLKVYGLAITPAEQKNKFAAIELSNGDLLDGRIKILKGSTLEDQLSSLQWVPDEFGRLREPKGVANHCFVAGTMVMTEYGERPIESVKAGDRVWTRLGLFPVRWAGQTGIQPTVSAEFTGGRTLVGTRDHQIWTVNGWKDLALLTPDDTFVEWESMGRALLSYSEGRSTDGTRRARTSACGGTSLHPTASSCTEPSTALSAALSLLGTMCTTGTATTQTIGYPTSRPSTAESTSAPTAVSLPERRSRDTTSSRSPCLRLASGTEVRQVSSGIAATVSERWLPGPCSDARARSADRSFNPSSPMRPCAARSAELSTGAIADSTTSRSCASSAAASPRGIGTPSEHVSVRLIAVGPTGRSEPVFDLTVDGPPEFFANGVLVHNSADSFLYARRLIAHMFETGIVDKPPPGNDGSGAPPGPAYEQPEYEEQPEGPDWSYLYR